VFHGIKPGERRGGIQRVMSFLAKRADPIRPDGGAALPAIEGLQHIEGFNHLGAPMGEG
jgi:hypothetical protein